MRFQSILPIAGFVVFVLSIAAADADADADQTIDGGYGEESIAQELEQAHQAGDDHPRLSLNADVVDQPQHSHEETEQSQQSPPASQESTLTIHVREPIQAVTPTTIVSARGTARQAGELRNTVLVADVDAEESGTMALLRVDKETGDVDGFVQKPGGEKMKVTQKRGERAKAFRDKEFVPPKWECGVGKTAMKKGKGGTGRHLAHSGHDHATTEHVDGMDHDHSHRHDHSHHFDGKSPEHALLHIKDSLRGSNINLGQRRRLENDGDDNRGYNYQIDLYLEVDQRLVNLNGGIFDPNTVEYVNTIVTGANLIYEPEIDTHLNVKHINQTDHYDGYTDTVEALYRMKEIYGGDNWHAEGINLHHALLGKDMGGGVAFLGTVCDSTVGFGLSANLQGNFESIDSAVVWDLGVFAHELGHNFNSVHTFDDGFNGYNPVIDECKPLVFGMQCPSQLPLEGSATIMSYCHLCPGGLSNMDYTFGGKYTGSGSRGDVESYDNSPLAGSVSYEPRRVNVVMYDHVSTRGTCAEAPAVTEAPTASPTKSPSSTMPPSESPTAKLPSDAPTKKPATDAPTRMPSAKTTYAPSKSPTAQPVVSGQTTSPTPCLGMLVSVEVNTDNRPWETSWTLVNTDTGRIEETNPVYSQAATRYVNRYCLVEAPYRYTIYDSVGNGMCCTHGAGSYEVRRGSTVVASGDEFVGIESTTFAPVSNGGAKARKRGKSTKSSKAADGNNGKSSKAEAMVEENTAVTVKRKRKHASDAETSFPVNDPSFTDKDSS